MDVNGFENDLETFHSSDDVLTLLIHLGYLTYHEDDRTVRIPNEEVRREFHQILKGNGVSEKWVELPSGRGLADLVYIPEKNSPLPGMVIELKWDESAEGAIKQIKDKKYPAILQPYVGELLLVGIAYDPKSKEHTCHIENFRR